MVTEKQIVNLYKANNSIRATAAAADICESAIRKVLITSGEYTSPRMVKIVELQKRGMTTKEIAAELGVKESTIKCYLPYSRGSYLFGEKSKNALRIQRWRRKGQQKEAGE